MKNKKKFREALLSSAIFIGVGFAYLAIAVLLIDYGDFGSIWGILSMILGFTLLGLPLYFFDKFRNKQ